MNLKHKAIAIISATTIALTIVLYFFANYIFLHTYTKIEKNNTAEYLKRSIKAIEMLENELDLTLRDWSEWDDTYEFVTNKNQEYIESNLLDSTFSSAKLALIAFLDNQGTPLYIKYLDPVHKNDDGKTCPYIENMFNSNKNLFSRVNTTHSIKGLVNLPDGILLIAARPVLKSDKNGPQNGIMIMGRIFGAEAKNNMESILNRKTELISIYNKVLNEQYRTALENTRKDPIYLDVENKDVITGYIVIEDIFGRQNLLLKIQNPRNIYNQGIEARNIMLFVIAISGLVFCIAIILLLQTNIISSISKLKLSAEKISAIEEISEENIEINRNDEIGDLALSFNKMLEKLRNNSRELMENQKRINMAFDAANEGIWEWNVDSGEMHLTPKYFKMLGFEPYEIPSTFEALVSRINLEDKDSVLSKINECVYNYSKNNITLEFRVLSKNNNWLWALVKGKVVERREDGKAVKMSGTHLDVTSQKVAENVLRESQQLYETILNNSSDMIFMVDCDGIVTYHNHAVDKHYELDEDLDHSVHISYFWCGESIAKIQSAFYLLLSHKQAISTDCRCGEEYYEVNFSPIFTNNEVSFVICVARDISIRKRSELYQEKARITAEQANKLKDEFLANMSHELRTPLNSIIGFSEVIASSEDINDIHNKARIILNESDILLSLINNSLDHAKIKAGKLEIAKEPFDMYELIDILKNSNMIHAMKKGISFSVRISDDVENYYVGDWIRIKQVLTNLINNAIKFTEKGSVTVNIEKTTVRKKSHILKFSVNDTGIGIEKNKQAEIFRRFTQADSSTTRRYGGTGLGTTISKELVNLMGGEIHLTSTPGKGSCFWFTLPLQKTTKTNFNTTISEKQIPMDTESRYKSRILVVDDYQANLEIARTQLESAGHTVTITTNGAEAINLLNNRDFDLVIMDVQMPEMDGYDATRRIRNTASAYKNIPILGMTANSSIKDVQNCKEAGMNDVIIKPVRRADILQKVDKLMNNSSVEIASPATEDNSNAEKEKENPEPAAGILPIDFEKALYEFGWNKELLVSLVKKLINDQDNEIGKMQAFIAEENWKDLSACAHKLYGGSSNLVANKIAGVARKIEFYDYNNVNKNQVIGLVNQLNECFNELKEYCNSLF